MNPAKRSVWGVIRTVLLAAVFLAAAGGAAWYLLSGGVPQVTQTKRSGIAAKPTQKETLNMIGHWKGEDLREDFVTETVNEFVTRNPSLAVNIKWDQDFENGPVGALQAIVDQFKTGKIVWDVIWLEPSSYQEIAAALQNQDWARNFLVDFESVPGFRESQKPFIISDPQYRNHMNGVITGPYIEGFYQPFFYNKDLTDKMGIVVKEKGMTYNDLLGYFNQVAEYNKAHGAAIPTLYDTGDYRGGIGYASSAYNIFQSLFRSEFASLAELQDTEPSETKMAAVRKTLAALEVLGRFKPYIPGWKDLGWTATRGYVLDDKAVFTASGGSWMYSIWNGINPQKTVKMVPVEMPVFQPVNYCMGGYNPIFAVANDSPVRNEAVKLLMSFSTPNSAEKWVRYAKAPSGIKGNISRPGQVSSAADQFDGFITYMTDKYGGSMFDSETIDYILGEEYKDLTLKFSMHLADVMDGAATAEEAYNDILRDMRSVDNP